MIEGSTSEFIKALEHQIGPNRFSNLRIHSVYNTAEMKIDGFPVDLATARA